MRCWTPTGKEIQLCGHGLLCCAHYWQSQWPDGVVLEMNGVKVGCRNRGGINWLSFPCIDITSVAVPDWAQILRGQIPAHAALAGPEDGYIILEMPNSCDLTSLQAPGALLCEHSQRSMIVTRRVSADTALCGETMQFRYFAPQHGVPEDTATGSAMRVLAAYWQMRGAGTMLQALQRSGDGGWLASHIENDRTWIGGHVARDKVAA